MRETGMPELAPVEKMVSVPQTPEAAFELFTRGMTRWWPLETHSVGGSDTVEVVFEERAGGRVYERGRDGSTSEWGRVLEWDPPRRFVMTWHPGRESGSEQRLEVRFVGVGAGTRVELTHTGWEHLGDRATAVRAGYIEGWEPTLGRFVELASG